jgi:antitoxin (DNA-binding transcriptional repressor) of toxin-antitoxin stability system
METISKSKLKANMLQVFRELEASGQTLIVTDRSRPVLKIVPIKERSSVDELFGPWRDQVVIHEDLDLPTQDEWEELP